MKLSNAGLALLVVSMGCRSDETVADAHQVAYQDGTVAETLEILVAAENRRARKDEDASIPVSAERVAALEQRIVELELQLSRIQTTGVLPASTIGFDPRATTLSGQDVQSALTELHSRVKSVEEKSDSPMGEAGPGMFTKVTPKMQGGQQGGMMQGGMMQGGQQGGMMQGGQQGGMMQGGQQGGMMQGGQQGGQMQGGQMQGGQQGGQMQGGQQGGQMQGGQMQGGQMQGGQQGGQQGSQGSSGR